MIRGRINKNYVIYIPAYIRKKLNVKVGDSVEFVIENDKVSMRKITEQVSQSTA